MPGELISLLIASASCRAMLGETKFGQHNYGKDYQDGFLETVEDDWLAPLSDGLEATQLGPDPSGDIRRVNSSPAMHFRPSGGDSANLTGAWEGSTAPLPIRPMRCMNPDDFSSLESSQSLLNCGHGSYTDDSALMHRQHTGSSVMHRKGSFGAGVRYPHSMPLQSNYSMEGPPFVPQDALSAVEYTMSGNIPCSYPMPPPNPPGQSGHWAWIPADHEAPGACPVPVASGPVRLPVPVNSSFDFDLDLQLLDGVDILEMADTLAPEVAPTRPRNLPRAVGSCPLPALLEDSLSAEDVSETLPFYFGMEFLCVCECVCGLLAFAFAAFHPLLPHPFSFLNTGLLRQYHPANADRISLTGRS